MAHAHSTPCRQPSCPHSTHAAEAPVMTCRQSLDSHWLRAPGQAWPQRAEAAVVVVAGEVALAAAVAEVVAVDSVGIAVVAVAVGIVAVAGIAAE